MRKAFFSVIIGCTFLVLPLTALASGGAKTGAVIGGGLLLGGLVGSSLNNVASPADAMCVSQCAKAAAQKPPKPCPQTYIVCKALTTTGFCMPDGCKGQSYVGLNGQSQGVGSTGGFSDILKGAMGILQQLMKGSGSGSGSGSQSTGSASVTGNGCTYYYTVTVPTSDPCAQYIAPVSNSLTGTGTGGTQANASDQLLAALGGGSSSALNASLGGSDAGTTPTNVSDQLLTQTNTNTNTNTNSNSGGTPTADTGTPPVSGDLASQAVNLQSGTRGDIVITNSGGTVVANARDTQANTEVAGFYGGDTFNNTQPTGLIAQMCQSRPWAGSVVSFIIPPSFFDSLCAWRGYQVGTPAPAATQTSITQTSAPKPQTAPVVASPAVPNVPPEVDIWAVPASVPLGARTSVFWNTKGVASCTESSPDGNFNETSLSGGASTVPLTGATVFTISCLDASGKPVTNSTTVNLAI